MDTDREKWLKAIQNDKLIWPNVSDLKGWNNEVAKLYKITGVPSNFLIDPRGKVIGYNLNEEELSHQLREINSPAGASL